MLTNPDVRNWISVTLASVIACGSGLGDAVFSHVFGSNADLLLLMGGLGALGLHITAVNVANTVTKAVNNATNGPGLTTSGTTINKTP